MIKSINAWAFSPGRSLADMFRLARDAGFEAVEVVIDETGPISPTSTEADCRRIVDDAAKADVRLASLASGLGWRYPVTCTNPVTVRKGIDLVSRSLRIAGWLGVDAILMVPGGVAVSFIPDFPQAPYDIAYGNTLTALAELRPVAEHVGVNIGIENVWNMFLLSPLEMRDLLNKAGSPFIGSYLDVGNMIVTGYAEQWIRILAHRIKRVHFKDYKRSIGTLAGFCGLLEGDVDYPAVMQALREVGYDSFVTAEYFNCEQDLTKISRAMDKILGS